MTIEKLKDYLIKRGIESVKKTEKDEKKIGGLEGFEMCQLLKTPEDFDKKLIELYEEGQAIQQRRSDLTKEETGLYWRIRYQALQVEFVFERLKCAWRFSTISARAVKDYQEILEKEQGG